MTEEEFKAFLILKEAEAAVLVAQEKESAAFDRYYEARNRETEAADRAASAKRRMQVAVKVRLAAVLAEEKAMNAYIKAAGG